METEEVAMTMEASSVDGRPSPEEFLLLFPVFPATPPSLSDVPAPTDPASELRALKPLTRDAVLDGLGSVGAGFLALATRLQLSAMNIPGGYAILRGLFFAGFYVPVVASASVFDTGATYGSRNLIARTVISTILISTNSWGNGLFFAYRQSLLAFNSATATAPRDLSSLPSAGLVRWIEATHLPGEPLPLLSHVSGDALCPCALTSCAGSVPTDASRLRLLEMVCKSIFLACNVLFWGFVPMFSLPGQFWTTPWTAVCGALYIVAGFVFSYYPTVLRFNGSPPLLQLSRRLQTRAMSRALACALKKVRKAALNGEDAVFPTVYMELSRVLTGVWKSRVNMFNFTKPLALSVIFTLVAMGLTMIISSCLPVAYLSYAFYMALLALIDLVNVAASNAAISSTLSLYLDAQRELRELVDEASQKGTLTPTMLQRISTHDRILASYLEADRYKGTFSGFVVDYGIVRTVVVTVITIVVGLWSILRGLGKYAAT
ncbi:hypothetical protein DFJ74DRAFT_702864 [Hyaloraphidium curvatum]|nr:hypothetical protein DFJ74DRAFT_702864 [Hyaloraphidium curvatum]